MEYRDITPDDEKENKCMYCGYECHNTFCSIECERADYKENCQD